MQKYQFVQDLDGSPVEIEVQQVEQGMLGDIIVSVQTHPIRMDEGPGVGDARGPRGRQARDRAAEPVAGAPVTTSDERMTEMTQTRAARRAGQLGQIDPQGRSHEAADCGTYRLVRRVGPNRWEVEYVAACDGEYGRSGTLQFVSAEHHSRYF